MVKGIVRNFSYVVLAQVVSKAVSFFYTIYLARSLGVENFGLLTVALSYFALISSVSDFGISRYLIREVAKDRGNLTTILTSVFVLRLSALSAIFCLFALLVTFYDPQKTRAVLTIIAVFSVLPQAVALTLDSIFIALQKISLSAWGIMALSLSTAIFGVLLLSLNFGVLGAAAALILGQSFYALFLVIIAVKTKVNLLSGVSFKVIKEVIYGSLPYGLLGVLGLLYFRIDSLLLAYLRGSYETGLYGAAYKFLEAIVFIPSAFSVVIFPIFAKLHEQGPLKVKPIYYKSLAIMFGISVVIFVSYILILPNIIKVLLPQYSQSIPAIKILSLTIPFLFLHSPAVYVLFSSEKYLKDVILISFATLGFNVLANIYFINLYGFIGASWVTVFSEMISFIIFFLLLQFKVFKR